MKYLWADAVSNEDNYYFIGCIENEERAVGSFNLSAAIQNYVREGLFTYFHFNKEDKPMLPLEFLE